MVLESKVGVLQQCWWHVIVTDKAWPKVSRFGSISEFLCPWHLYTCMYHIEMIYWWIVCKKALVAAGMLSCMSIQTATERGVSLAGLCVILHYFVSQYHFLWCIGCIECLFMRCCHVVPWIAQLNVWSIRLCEGGVSTSSVAGWRSHFLISYYSILHLICIWILSWF